MTAPTEQERCLQNIAAQLERIADALDVLALPVRRYFQMEAIVEKHAEDRGERVSEVLGQARKEKG